MKLFFHYCLNGFSNCYVLGSNLSNPVEKRDAVIIDPGSMDEPVLKFLEDNDYTLRAALVTHDHRNHVHGLRTLKRIYDVDIYAVNHVILDYRTNMVRDGDTLSIGPFTIGVISVPGHSSDSAVFRIDNLLFTGDVMTAGLVGSTASSYGATVQMTALRSKILSLPGDVMVLPGHGPPSSLEAERRFNAGVQFYEEQKKQRPFFAPGFFQQLGY